jgi:hypothetical protein
MQPLLTWSRDVLIPVNLEWGPNQVLPPRKPGGSDAWLGTDVRPWSVHNCSFTFSCAQYTRVRVLIVKISAEVCWEAYKIYESLNTKEWLLFVILLLSMYVCIVAFRLVARRHLLDSGPQTTEEWCFMRGPLSNNWTTEERFFLCGPCWDVISRAISNV